MIENAFDFDPPDPERLTCRQEDDGFTNRAMPTDRVSVVSIIVSTTNPDTTSRIPLRRSQARVSASDAGGLRPNDPVIRSGDIR